MAGSVEQAYDNDFRIARRTVNGADPVTFQYDQDSLLIQAGALAIQRDPQNGLITGTTLGQVTTTQTYNGFGELATFEARVGSVPVFTAQYTIDPLGRITRKVETI